MTSTVPCGVEDPDIDGLDSTLGTPIKHGRLGDYQAIGRDDTDEVFKVFKSGYQIHQYREWLLGSVANLIDANLAIGSAGLLQNGGTAWVSIELPADIETPSGLRSGLDSGRCCCSPSWPMPRDCS